MSEASQLLFDFLELGHHPLLGRLTPYDQGSVVPALPTIVCEAQTREGALRGTEFPAGSRVRFFGPYGSFEDGTYSEWVAVAKEDLCIVPDNKGAL